MRWFAKVQNSKYTSFAIEQERLKDIMGGPDMDAFYLYVYKGDEVVADEMQDTLDITMQQALEDYGVPLDVWVPVEGPNLWRTQVVNRQFDIHHDLVTGFHLVVSEKDIVVNDTDNKRYRQDSLEEIKQVALEDYGVPLDAWKVIT